MRRNKNDRVRDLQEYRESRANTLRTGRLVPRAGRMHGKQKVRAQLLPFTLRSGDHGWPSGLGNSAALLPLADSPMTLTDSSGHIGQALPDSKHVVEGLHSPYLARDNLSGQARTPFPVTKAVRPRTIRPMGARATTPTSFKREFCSRLRAARIMANLDQAEFARSLGLLPNTYGKYEKRSLLPHHLVPVACEILGIQVSELYGVEKRLRKTA